MTNLVINMALLCYSRVFYRCSNELLAFLGLPRSKNRYGIVNIKPLSFRSRQGSAEKRRIELSVNHWSSELINISETSTMSSTFQCRETQDSGAPWFYWKIISLFGLSARINHSTFQSLQLWKFQKSRTVKAAAVQIIVSRLAIGRMKST